MATIEQTERVQFSERLWKALRKNDIPITASTVASMFNTYARGRITVSNYTVRKWLDGQALPTNDKIRILSQWLGVRMEWLAFGEQGDVGYSKKLSADEIAVLAGYRALKPAHRKVLTATMHALAVADTEKQ
jgi:transcriptional regulator with XRE-family HTH domain